MLFCMKLINLLVEETKIKVFKFYPKQGKNHAIEKKHEESVTKLMTNMLWKEGEGTTALFPQIDDTVASHMISVTFKTKNSYFPKAHLHTFCFTTGRIHW